MMTHGALVDSMLLLLPQQLWLSLLDLEKQRIESCSLIVMMTLILVMLVAKRPKHEPRTHSTVQNIVLDYRYLVLAAYVVTAIHPTHRHRLATGLLVVLSTSNGK